MKLLHNIKINKILKTFKLEETIKIKITESDFFYFNLREVLSFVFENKIGKQKRKHLGKRTGDYFIKICNSFVIRDLMKEKEKTLKIYKNYLKEKDKEMFLTGTGNELTLSLLELEKVIMKKLIKENELYKLSLEVLHLTSKEMKAYTQPEEFKKIEEEITEDFDNIKEKRFQLLLKMLEREEKVVLLPEEKESFVFDKNKSFNENTTKLPKVKAFLNNNKINIILNGNKDTFLSEKEESKESGSLKAYRFLNIAYEIEDTNGYLFVHKTDFGFYLKKQNKNDYNFKDRK